MTEPQTLVRLNLGCGHEPRPGWINIDRCAYGRDDILVADLSEGLPPTPKAVVIYSSHLIEHLTEAQALRLMQDSFQRLEPCGRFRMAVPNFFEVARAYVTRSEEYFKRLNWDAFSGTETRTLIDAVSYCAYDLDYQHRSIWDFDKARKFLQTAGFAKVFLSSFTPELDDNVPIRKKYSMYVDAIA